MNANATYPAVFVRPLTSRRHFLEAAAIGAGVCLLGVRGGGIGQAASRQVRAAVSSVSGLDSYVDAGGARHVFGVSPGGSLQELTDGSGTWQQRDASNGRLFVGTPAVTYRAGRCYLFAIGGDGTAWSQYRYDGGGWSGWRSMGGATFVGGLEAVIDSRFAHHVVGVTSSGGLLQYEGLYDSGFTLQDVSNGGVLVGTPAMVYRDGRYDAFGIGTDGAAWQQTFQEGSPSWTPWRRVGGSNLLGGLDVGRQDNGSFLLVGVDSANRLQQFGSTSGSVWNAPRDISNGGRVVGAPSLMLSSGRLDTVAVGMDGQAWMQTSVNSGPWSGWGPIGGFGPTTAPVVPGPPPSAQYRPVSFPTLAAAQAVLALPAGAEYVMWPGGTTKMLEEVFMGMTDNQILVLPERAQPYEIDSADGFRAAGVTWIENYGVRTPIASTYKGKTARTWFAMTRTRRGILGLGPGVVIQPSASSFSRGRQAAPPNLVTSTGQRITGTQETLIECAIPNAYFGNFILRSRDFGGVAYNGIRVQGGTFENLLMQGAHRSFDKEPNGETGGICINSGSYLIRNVEVDGRDQTTGQGSGASPFMLSSCTGGRIEKSYVHNCSFPWIQGGVIGGGPAWWNCSNTHTLTDFRCETPGSFNLEINQPSFLFDWTGGSILANMPDGTPRMHFNIRSKDTSQKISIKGVTLGGGRVAGVLDVQSYAGAGEQRKQLASDITCTNASGIAVPVRLV